MECVKSDEQVPQRSIIRATPEAMARFFWYTKVHLADARRLASMAFRIQILKIFF